MAIFVWRVDRFLLVPDFVAVSEARPAAQGALQGKGMMRDIWIAHHALILWSHGFYGKWSPLSAACSTGRCGSALRQGGVD